MDERRSRSLPMNMASSSSWAADSSSSSGNSASLRREQSPINISSTTSGETGTPPPSTMVSSIPVATTSPPPAPPQRAPSPVVSVPEHEESLDATVPLEKQLSAKGRRARRCWLGTTSNLAESKENNHDDDDSDDSPSQIKIRRLSSIMDEGYALLDSRTTGSPRGDANRTASPTTHHDHFSSPKSEKPMLSASSSHHFVSPRSSALSHHFSPKSEKSAASASRQRHAHPSSSPSKTEPFIKSLGKSLEILNKRQGSQTSFKVKDPIRHKTRDVLRTVLHLTVFSILGAALRVFLGRLLGGVCHADENGDADTASDATWMESAVPNARLCVTSTVEQPGPGGAALFTDLPANMLGCFLMGVLQPSQDLGLLTTRPIVFLNSEHWFQSWGVVHLALRTGFCGSLTTFASWNSQMVQLLDGYLVHENGGGSQPFAAMFGYIIGLELALASLVFGQTVAIWFHRFNNQDLAKVEDMMVFAFAKETDAPSSAETVPLPDYERRYLAYLLPREEHEWAKKNISVLQDLESWKLSTDRYRLEASREFHSDEDDNETGGGWLLSALHGIERTILVDELELDERQRQIAEKEGWDVKALERFAKEANRVPSLPPLKGAASKPSMVQYLWVSLPFVLALSILLSFALLDWKKDGSEEEFYRQMWMSCLLAPLGTIVRWRLSSLNGALNGALDWFPVGTFTANLVASMLSAVITGVTDAPQWNGSAATSQLLYALKTGFAGSMSTVSTFAVEGNLLQQTYRHHAKAYYYMLGTIVTACVLGLVMYSPLVRSEGGEAG